MAGERKERGVVNRMLWGAGYALTFVAVFVVAGGVGLTSSNGLGSVLTLQGEGDNSDVLESAARTTMQVPYIDKDGIVQERPIVLYEPEGGGEARALVFVPHYEVETGSADFGNYLREGWAVASPTEVDTSYNGTLTDDDLVFNNAALHTLRALPQVDPQRIAVVGGSAGGYTALMLGALQLGATTTVAAAPIANAYFNFDQYFTTVDTATRRDLDAEQIEHLDSLTQPQGATANSLRLLLWARLNGLPFPLLATVLPSFAPIAQSFPSDSTVERWQALSPTGIARAITSPTVINHNTADILVPLDQITHRYAYQQMGQSMPEGFSNLMSQGYPGLLSSTLEEGLAPGSVQVNYTDVRGREGDVPMPATDALVNINVYDDGPPEANASHSAVDNRTVVSSLDYLRTHLRGGLAHAETLSSEKFLLLIDRYQGNSLQLPAHRGVSDTTYGSLAVYQQEIVDTLGRWSDNHSPEALEAVAARAIASLQKSQGEEAAETWTRVQDALSAAR